MKSQFSEFTYGFAITNELVKFLGSMVTSCPIFPSLLEEGRSGGGYDLNIDLTGKPIFLQFKLSDYLERTNSSEWSLFNSAYYRFKLMPLSYSQQHNMLLDLERAGNDVYYSAPKFNTNLDLNNNYLTDSIINESIFITPLSIGTLPDDKEHKIVFQHDCRNVYLCSEPEKIEYIQGIDFVNSLEMNLNDNNATHINNKLIIDIGKNMLSIIEKYHKNINYNELSMVCGDIDNDSLKFVSNLSRMMFGCEFFIIGKENGNKDIIEI